MNLLCGLVDLFFALCTGYNEASRGEYQYDYLGFIHPVDGPRELLRLIHYVIQYIGRCLQVSLTA